MENLTNFLPAIKAGATVLLLPVSNRQCFVFTTQGLLDGCLVLGDLTHYICGASNLAILAHEVIQTEDIDNVLTAWDYQTYSGVTPLQWLALSKVTK